MSGTSLNHTSSSQHINNTELSTDQRQANKRQRARSGLLPSGNRNYFEKGLMEGNIDARIEEISDEVSDLSSELALLRTHKNDTSKQIDILSAIVIKQSKTIKQLHSRVLNQEKRSMQQNILVHNVPEEKDENTDEKVSTFLKKKKIDDSAIRIDISHRIGAERKPNSYPRPIVVKMETRKAADILLQKTKPEKGVKRDRSTPYVTPHLPEEIREHRKRLYSLANVYRNKDKNAIVSIKNDHITVNKQKISCSVIPPTVQDVLTKHPQTGKNISIIASNEIQEWGSKFTLYAANVTNPSEVRSAYLKVSAIPSCAAATHLISAHRLADDNHSWNDDGDFGLGRFMYKTMCDQSITNKVFFLSRDFGGVHIGQRRFDIAQQLITEIVISGKEVNPTPTPTTSSFLTPKYHSRKFASALKRIPLATYDSSDPSLAESESSDKESQVSEIDANKTLTPGTDTLSA